MLQDQPEVPDPASALALGLALAGVGLAMTPFAMALARRLWPERSVFFARWGFTHLALLVLIFFVASVGVGLLWPMPESGELGLLGQFGLMGLIYLVVSAAIVRFAVRLEPDPRKALGFERGGNLRSVGLAVLVYLILLPGLMGLTLFWPSLLQLLGEDVGPQDVLVGFFELEGGALAIAVLCGTLVMPFFEELVFRGFLQPLLVQNFRDRGGVVLTSVVFGAMHGFTAFLPIFALSLMLGGVALRTRRLVSCWAMHALHNGLMIGLALSFPELRDTMAESGLLTFWIR